MARNWTVEPLVLVDRALEVVERSMLEQQLCLVSCGRLQRREQRLLKRGIDVPTRCPVVKFSFSLWLQ